MEFTTDFSKFLSFGGVPETKTIEEDKTDGGLTLGEGIQEYFTPKREEEVLKEGPTQKLDYKAEATKLMDKLIFTESSGIHREKDGSLLVSDAGAKGITQLMPRTAKKPGYGIKPLKNQTPEEYIRFGTDYLATMIKVFDDTEQGVAAYNAGPGTVHRAISKASRTGRDWKEFLPKETQEYIKKVTEK